MVKLLADHGADVNQGDSMGVSPLSRAVLRNSIDVAQVLIAKGAKLNEVDGIGQTPLTYAATRNFGSAEMVQFLLAAGANPTVKSKQGKTAKEVALQYGNTEQAAKLR